MTEGLLVRAGARMVLIPMLAVAAMMLAGCPDDDDDGKKGGGGTVIIPETFPPIPTGRPTLLGMPITINTSASAGNGSASGGNIDISAPAGTVMVDDGRAAPAVTSNFLTAAVLADNVVTLSELLLIDPANTVQNLNEIYVDVVSGGFHLPAGVTLDLTDADPPNVLIRTLSADGVIRIDGTVELTTVPDGVTALMLVSHAATGTAIHVGGEISGGGSSNVANGGRVGMYAEWGDIVVRGTLDLQGTIDLAGSSGDGGDVEIQAWQGDVVLVAGLWQANGIAGGSGGRVEVFSAESMTMAWGVRANGGDNSAGHGGFGGDLDVQSWATLTLNVPYEVNGGSGTGDNGGGGGEVGFVGAEVTGVATGSADGGDGSNGGSGGYQYIECNNVFGAAFDATSNGGASVSGSGGPGGSVQLWCAGTLLVNVLVDGEARGGDGASGGFGGWVELSGNATMVNAQLQSDVSGGEATSATGGDGGSTGIGIWSNLGSYIESATMVCVANGGNGVSGGWGGYIYVEPGAGNDGNVTATVTANGGAGVAGGPTGEGGRGGTFNAANSEGSSDWSLALTLSGSLAGGMSDNDDGGDGGYVELYSRGDGGWYDVTIIGTLNMRGGAALDTGNGGNGGSVYVRTGLGKVFRSGSFNIDMRGGDSAQGNGGFGPSPGRSGGFGLLFECEGSIDISGGTLNLSGGQGSTTAGTGTGGGGGEARFYTGFGDIRFAGTLLASGGDGAGGGGSAIVSNGEAVEFNADADEDGIAGTIRISGTVRANGGNCTGAFGSGGSGGFLWVNNRPGTEISGGDVFISGTLESNGGAGVGAQQFSGSGGGIEISGSGALLEISGVVRSNGGSGAFGGSARYIEVATAATTAMTISGRIESLAGGGDFGGEGGDIDIGSPSFGVPPATIDITGSAVIRSAAGVGTVSGGPSGSIEIDAQGSGGANITVDASATVDVLDGAGNDVPGNVIID